MKHSILPNKKMNNSFLVLILALLAFSITSCNKDDDEPTSEISEEEAAEVIAMAVSPESGGIVEQTTEAIYVIEVDNTSGKSVEDYECGVEYGSSYNRSGNTSTITYSVDYGWSWIVTCGEGLFPLAADFTMDGSSSYVGPKISSEGAITATIKVENLDGAQGTYNLAEDFSFNATQESFVRNKTTFTSTIKLTTSNLAVLKSNYNITSGTVAASFVGVSSSGNTYDFSGTVKFNGNQTATITMGSGNTYDIAW
tara:strand:- start:2186 stop:2947 length:762 start_codon:yes stop_codon:yes gene_type:complete